MRLYLVSRIFVHINLISDRIKLLSYDCELFFGLDSSFSIGTILDEVTLCEITFLDIVCHHLATAY